jgi:hypothetical protein
LAPVLAEVFNALSLDDDRHHLNTIML